MINLLIWLIGIQHYNIIVSVYKRVVIKSKTKVMCRVILLALFKF